MKHSFSTTKGFTLIETLVALSIFTLSVVGLISATAGGLNNTTYAKNKITAMALSAEGIELVRNIRDTNAISSATGWSDFLAEIRDCTTSAGCIIEAETLNSAPCPSSGCAFMRKYVNGSNAFYFGYQGSDATPFARTIKIAEVTPEEIAITSTVSWLQGSGIKSVSTEEHLMNWFTVPAVTTP